MKRLDGKRVLVYGLGVTGYSVVNALNQLGAKIYIQDDFWNEKAEEKKEALKGEPYTLWSFDFENPDFIVKSPGIARDTDFLKEANRRGIEVISDLELAYRLFGKDRIIAITGTNGKTTTTTLVGHLFQEANIPARIMGNIGIGMLKEMVEAKEEELFIVECSSFQLASTKNFTPHTAAILNITPDHLVWHHTMEDYIDSKMRVARNQSEEDNFLYWMEDPILEREEKKIRSHKLGVSLEGNPEAACYDDETSFVLNIKGKVSRIPKTAFHLPGRHNVQNALFALGIAKCYGISDEALISGLSSFEGVPHRIEFVREKDGVRYYNDSKATNVDSTLHALAAFPKDVVLIAGGMDKKVPLEPLFDALKGKTKALILLGETKYQMEELAKSRNIQPIYVVEDMRQAVAKAHEVATKGCTVLLSPASASWDMYPNFEVRGNEFKDLVGEL